MTASSCMESATCDSSRGGTARGPTGCGASPFTEYAVPVPRLGGDRYGCIGRWSGVHGVCLDALGIGNVSVEMLEKSLFRLSSVGRGVEKASVDSRREMLSRRSAPPPSFPSMLIILSASSLM